MDKKEKGMIISALENKRNLYDEQTPYDCLVAQSIEKAIDVIRDWHTEPLKESNFEHYASEILGEAQKHGLKNGFFTIYYNRSGVSRYNTIHVDDIINWLLKPYKLPKNKGTKFEYDLLKTNDQSHDRKVCSFATYVNMKNEGYFKGVHFDQTIKEVLNNWEFDGEK